ncbi:galactose-1-phosphate uridylyltransferase [Patescibacteria group bacterium]|nr:galactose-1-phosphate uridylyltransferase [Patescibacteria group bacterium]MBU1074951.1 galactose-1-phosphate uridylyltransferase [Patescibacteria group bacterium]MBU1952511.1 galactose-1-phosphate uridylyltransferase [Patescibacteria group bacterium]
MTANIQKPEIRKDYIQDKYVIIAPRRGKRPHDFEQIVSKVSREKKCVFCPENVEKDLIIRKYHGQGKNWSLLTLKNKFPAVTLDNSEAYGTQEVIIETPDHAIELENLPESQIKELFDVYAERTYEISKIDKIEYILIFKNDGGKAGQSIAHAHSQVFATAFLPPHLIDKSQKTQKYKLENGTCVYCDVIEKERKGPRFVFEDKNVIAFTPYASIHNYEIWIMPKRHLDNITVLTSAERMSFAKTLKKILLKVAELGLPYNYYFHQVINDEDQHLYMKITPRGSIWAGVEIGSGVIINSVSPEDAAEFYRE